MYTYSYFHQTTSEGFMLHLILEISNICMVCSSPPVFFGSRIKPFTFDEIKLEFIHLHESESIQKNYRSHRSMIFSS